MAAIDLIDNVVTAVVTTGGASAPVSGTVESWTVIEAEAFPSIGSGGTQQFRVIDKADVGSTSGFEIMLVTARASSTAWTVTRGAEGTTPKGHGVNWTCELTNTAAGMNNAFDALGAANTALIAAEASAASTYIPLPASPATNSILSWVSGAWHAVISFFGKVFDTGGQVFNVMAYAATGNGTTNDTTAIAAAITALVAAGGGILFFPAGTYLITPGVLAIPSNCIVRGAGEGATTLIKSTNGILLDFSGSGTGIADHTICQQLNDITLNGGGFTGALCRHFYSSRFRSRNVTFTSNADIDLDCAELWDSRWYDPYFSLSGSTSIAAPNIRIQNSAASSGFGASAANSNDLHFYSPVFEGFYSGAVLVQPGPSNSEVADFITFENVKMESISLAVNTPFINVPSGGTRIQIRGGFGAALAYNAGYSTPLSECINFVVIDGFVEDFEVQTTGTATFVDGIVVYSSYQAFINNIFGNYASTGPTDATVKLTGGAGTVNVGPINATMGTILNVALAPTTLNVAANLESPAFTGSPTAPTQTTGDATTKIATDAFVATAVATAEASIIQTVIVTSTGAHVAPAWANFLDYIVVAGGGGGSGGGSATTSGGVTGQSGGGGGAQGQFIAGTIAVTPSESLTCTIGTGGGAGNGGAANNNPGTIGAQGGNSSIVGSGVSVTAVGGGPGNPGLGNNNSTIAIGGAYGTGQSTQFAPWSPFIPGWGGAGTNGAGFGGGAAIGVQGFSGGGGNSATATLGGVGGTTTGADTFSQTGSTAGGAGTAGVANSGLGGSGGGGGAPGGAGGNGAAGGSGQIILKFRSA